MLLAGFAEHGNFLTSVIVYRFLLFFPFISLFPHSYPVVSLYPLHLFLPRRFFFKFSVPFHSTMFQYVSFFFSPIPPFRSFFLISPSPPHFISFVYYPVSFFLSFLSYLYFFVLSSLYSVLPLSLPLFSICSEITPRARKADVRVYPTRCFLQI